MPNRTHLIEVELPLNPGAIPHRHAPSRLGIEGEKIVDAEVDAMERSGTIRKSKSAWASRVVLMTKKDGSVRFCTDYRDLTSKLQLEDSPLPLTAETIDRLSSGQGSRDSLFLCVQDLASGFWGLPVREGDKGKMAFVTHRGKYEFNYLPFGVQSGPSAVLEGLAWDICMPYLDDIGVFSTGNGDTFEVREEASFQQMLHRLDLVLERLIWAGLTCKMSKCGFFCTKAEYLGPGMSHQLTV
jgi:putative transposase